MTSCHSLPEERNNPDRVCLPGLLMDLGGFEPPSCCRFASTVYVCLGATEITLHHSIDRLNGESRRHALVPVIPWHTTIPVHRETPRGPVNQTRAGAPWKAASSSSTDMLTLSLLLLAINELVDLSEPLDQMLTRHRSCTTQSIPSQALTQNFKKKNTQSHGPYPEGVGENRLLCVLLERFHRLFINPRWMACASSSGAEALFPIGLLIAWIAILVLSTFHRNPEPYWKACMIPDRL